MTTTKQKNARRLKKREKIGEGSSLTSFHKFLSQNSNLTPEYVPGVTVLTAEEVARHNSPSDMWTIYRGNVYNLGPFLDYHPGGEEELMKAAGVDSTALYDQVHPWVSIDAVMGHLKLGPLRGNTPKPSPVKVVSKHSSAAVTPAKSISLELPPLTVESPMVSALYMAPIAVEMPIATAPVVPAVPIVKRHFSFNDIIARQTSIFQAFASVMKNSR